MEILNILPRPTGLKKAEIIDLLLREEYGYLPAEPYSVTANYISRDAAFCAGKADLVTLELSCKATWGEFTFPLYYVCPKGKDKPIPCFIHINFRNLIPDKYQPTEELVDAGYATLTFCYKDVASDDSDFGNGLARIVYPDGKRKSNQCGKIGLWAWAALRVLEYALTLPELDPGRISVAGHSRLGKTALLAGALDERFYCAFSNDSGCSGAALSREKKGETIRDICKTFPYWFCKNYEKYVDREEELPFDQHYLLAANIPHKVYVASAVEDQWSHPENEYLSCVAASEYYEGYGLTGFIHPERMACVGDSFQEGSIGYHLRSGKHYFSREDWNQYLRYLEKQYEYHV